VADFDGKLKRQHRNSWRGQQLELEVTEDGKRVLTIYVARRDGYRKEDPSAYEVKVIDPTEHHCVEVSVLELDSGHVKVAVDG
jgi:hypothetical protein